MSLKTAKAKRKFLFQEIVLLCHGLLGQKVKVTHSTDTSNVSIIILGQQQA